MEPRHVEIAGKRLACNHCGGDLFTMRDAQLHTAGMTLFKLEWLNRSADIYVCDACGHLHWFLEAAARPRHPAIRLPETRPAVCRNCNTRLLPEDKKCPECGWTWLAESEAGHPPSDPPPG